ncbi:Outer membrane protein assembly factor BamB [Sphingomonas antarctica]|uniref:outer membrane protein assembly factor BamB family protein n=1 Tax=Sphingomonas antarctica TaxID=2040274 RepID=UPI0039EAA889
MMKHNRGAIVLAMTLALAGCGVFKKAKPKGVLLGERVSILTAESGVETDPSLASVPVSLPAPIVNDSWAMTGGSADKSLGHLALSATPTRIWEARIAGGNKQSRLAATPVVAGGRLYAMGVDATVTAFDANTGAKIWAVQFGDPAKGDAKSLFGGGVSVDGDTLYVTNGLGDAGALKAADGSLIWRKKLGAPLRGSPTVDAGSIYVITQDNQLFALNTADGATQWTSAAAVQLANVFGAAAPSVAQGTVVEGFSSGDLNAYRYENGRTLWNDALSRTSINTSVGSLTDVDAGAVIDQGRVFALGQGGRMVALELVTGQRAWELNIAGISTPSVAGDWVFVVTDEAKLLCVSRGTGKVKWVTQLRRYTGKKNKGQPVSWSGPVLAGGNLWLVNTEGQMQSVSPETGAAGGIMQLKAPMSLPPIVANSTLYVLTNDGRIIAFR